MEILNSELTDDSFRKLNVQNYSTMLRDKKCRGLVPGNNRHYDEELTVILLLMVIQIGVIIPFIEKVKS